MAKDFEYVGNLPHYRATQYATKKYTHTEIIKKKEVKFYDCWKIIPPVSGFSEKNLEPEKVEKVHQIFGKGKAANANREALRNGKKKNWLEKCISSFDKEQ